VSPLRRIKTEFALIGCGGAAMLAANRLISQGHNVALINPLPAFAIDDIRPYSGLGLWNSAYRSQDNVTLPHLYDRTVARLRDAFPAALENSGFTKTEFWSVLSSTPVHRLATEELEREFFRLERKSWSHGQFRLVNPEHVLARTRRLGVDLTQVAQVEGAVIRAYGLWWNAAQMGHYLTQFIHNKFGAGSDYNCFTDASIEGRYGRRLVLELKQGEEVSVEAERAVLIFLSGELLPAVKTIVAGCSEPWIQGVRKKRREQHFARFEKNLSPSTDDGSSVFMELGNVRYRWQQSNGVATWQSIKGPDGLEKVVDEGLRLHSVPRSSSRFVHADRAFTLEWEWKNAQWRGTSHDTYWATAFEGDLSGVLELLWNLPSH